MAVQTRTDRRFRRAHVKPLRRRRAETTRRAVYGAAAVVFVMLCGFLAPDVLRTSRFLEIDSIVVEGNTRVSEGEVLALIGQLHGQNILTADLEANRDQLLMSGLIEGATLSRILPSTVKVSVVEREPAGLARLGGRLYLMDAGGTFIEEHGPRFQDVDLPIVDGLSAGEGAVIDERRAELASSLIVALTADRGLAARVSQIGVGDPHDAVVLLHDEPTLIHLGQEQFVERLRHYVDLAPTLRSYVPELDYVDMRFGQRVFVGSPVPGESRSLSIQR
jgi:cell division protein FtsQ